jgi:hypothetical protein
VTKNVLNGKPYAAVYYQLTPGSPAPRMLRINVTTTGGMSDPLVQILRIGASNALVDLHRSDRTAWSKTINMDGLTKVFVIVGSREHGGDFTVNFDEVASATDVMVTRWNTAAGTEYEVDPAGWAWAWVSPDVMVDTNNDLLEDGSVFFAQNNRLKIRLRNRGNALASNIRVDFWYQKATPYLTSAGWIPVRNTTGITQQLTGLSLGAGADGWFAVDWAPVDDGTHHNHWCVKVVVTAPGDPNTDNKMAFRNFNNVVAGGPDTKFDALIRFAEWSEGDHIQIVPRGPRATLVLANPEAFPKPVRRGCDLHALAQRLIHGIPLNMAFAQLRVAPLKLREWDRRNTLPPKASGAFYPLDERTLPPGVKASEIVTVAYVRNSRPFGGVSYRLSKP